MLNKLKKYLLRRKTPVVFNDALRTEPVSSVMGTERGTPLDRYYIENFLRRNCTMITGDVLEIAESTYSQQFGHDVSCYDVLHVTADNPKATIIGDLTHGEFLPENRVDCFICTQTFNFIYDINAAMAGAFRIIKSGGILLGTVSCISQISRFDMERWGDYWRFTDLAIRRLLESAGFEDVETVTYGNVSVAKLFLDGVVVEDLPQREILDTNDPDYPITIGFSARKP